MQLEARLERWPSGSSRRRSTSTPRSVHRLPRRRHQRRAPPAGPGDARRHRPGHRVARLPRRQPRLPGRPSPEQAVQLRQLRERISTIVGEVRSSVQSLRTEIGASQSLGTAISGLGPTAQRQLVDPDPRHRRRRPDPAAHRGRGRAAADRPGGDDRTPSGTRERRRSRSSAACTHPRRRSSYVTTARACGPGVTTPRASTSCTSGPGWPGPTSASTRPSPRHRRDRPRSLPSTDSHRIAADDRVTA